MTARLNKSFQKSFNISHSLRFMITWTQLRYWREYWLDKLRTGTHFCDEGGEFV